MDDLSKHTGISKKTICQYFADKDVLVHAIVNDLIQLHERLLNNFQAIAKDAIDEIVTLDTELFGNGLILTIASFMKWKSSFLKPGWNWNITV